MMMTYGEAGERLQGRNKDRRKLQNNTYLERRPQEDGEDAYAVRLHSTDVVTFLPSGAVVLNSGGWQTVTTKDRINTYAPVRVWSESREWFVRRWLPGVSSWGPDDGAPTFPFFDGITFDAAGNVANAPEWADLEREAIARKKLRKQIQTFAKSAAEKVGAGMEFPDRGDCFFCQMVTDDGTPLGEASGNVDHLQSHVEEDYAPASLIWHAVKDRAGTPERAALWLGWDGARFGQGFWVDFQVRSAVRSYMAARLLSPGEGNGR